MSEFLSLPEAGEVLAGVLEEENRLLAALDLAAAAALLPAKQGAVAAFLRAQQGFVGVPPADLGVRLSGLVAENRRLLERGLAAQQRVIAVIVRAARQEQVVVQRYGSSGMVAGPRRVVPLAISARV